MGDIREFNGRYFWLSNFYPAEVSLYGFKFPTVENAYQAAKCAQVSACTNFTNISPAKAKSLGSRVPIREDWEEIKIVVMSYLIKQKFAAGSELAKKLVATTGVIEEGNWWGDTFWGTCNGIGENHLGELLMRRRAELEPPALEEEDGRYLSFERAAVSDMGSATLRSLDSEEGTPKEADH